MGLPRMTTHQTEKPLTLHVQVALALGWTVCHDEADMYHPPGKECLKDKNEGWGCDEEASGADVVHHYDTDWSATGPLIERYAIGIEPPTHQDDPVWAVRPKDGDPALSAWKASTCAAETRWEYETVEGSSALIAVCRLILALAAAGKLPETYPRT